MTIFRRRGLSRPNAVNVAHMVPRCRVLGPGERFALWVQGCPLHCPGCHNPQFIPFREATWLSVDTVVRRILGTDAIEGLTLVGGEPFAQAVALAKVAARVRNAGLSVMVYTGYTMGQLVSGKARDAKLLLRASDLLMDGPYQQNLPTQRPWRGSDNQRLVGLSARYASQIEEWNWPLGQQFEVRIGSGGLIEVLGIPPVGFGASQSAPVLSQGRAGVEEVTANARGN